MTTPTPLSLLLIDDSEDDALLLLRELRRARFDVSCSRVETAAEMGAALGQEKWDIVIADHSLLQFDSLAALGVLRNSGLDIPFIILSGTISEELAVAAMNAGARDYIFKGSRSRLIPAIERELREAQLRAQKRHAEEALTRSEDMLRSFAGRSDGMGRAGRAVDKDAPLGRADLGSELQRALRNDEFFLHYQPQSDAMTGRITGAEALVRWQHPDHGVLPPLHFIPALEDSGLMGPLTRWLLTTVCKQNRAWRDAGLPPIGVAVNLSTPEFYLPGLPEQLTEILRETGLDASDLEVEITEGVAMQNALVTAATLWKLRDIGVRVALDDFGTGYSSLSYLKDFPVNTLKIDRSFVGALETSSSDRLIVASIIALARSLNLKVIAEGVETRAQLAFLRTNGCDEVQGFLTGKPMAAEALGAKLNRVRASDTARD